MAFAFAGVVFALTFVFATSLGFFAARLGLAAFARAVLCCAEAFFGFATGCFFWQPQTNTLAHEGSEVEYTYRVTRPLTAILTKMPQVQRGFREAISLHVQPVAPEHSLKRR